MLCYRYASCCDHKGGSGGIVKGIGAVSTSPYDFQYIHVMKQLDAVCSHACRGSGNLINGFPFQRQSSQVSGHLYRGSLAAHDLIHNLFCFSIS